MKINTKSKNFKIILFSVIGLVVLVAVVLVLTLTAPKDTEDDPEQTTAVTTEDPALILQPEDVGEIKSIYVENSLGSYTVNISQKDGEKVYSLKGMEDLDEGVLDSSLFGTLEKNLTDMTARSVVEENPTDIAQYGLDKPLAKATVTYENGTFTIMVGNTVTTGSANYLMVEGKDTVYSYYTYSLDAVLNYDAMSFVSTAAMPMISDSDDARLTKITVKRKDWEEPLILEALPELPEDSTSIQVFAYTFTSPYNVYLDLNTGTDYLGALSGLTAEKAVVVNPTEADYDKYGLSDPFCEVDELVGDTIYRLYIGDAITEEVKDEETGVTTTETVAYYGYTNKAPYAIFRFSADSLVWASMDIGTYMSKLFLMPYIYDLDTFSYKDKETEFTVKIDGGAEDCKFYLDGKETDGDNFRAFYQFVVSCRGEELYTDEEKGELLVEYTITYDDEREPNTVRLYSSDDRKVIINIDGKNIFKTKWNYETRLEENAKALVEGKDIIENF